MDEGHSMISSSGKKKRKKRKRSSDTNCKKSNSNSIATNNTTSSQQKVDGKKATEKTVTSIGKYPYPTDYNDHFETPARAYDDIYPLLEYVLSNKQKCNAQAKKKESGSNNEATIYDPYYCAGRAGTLLDNLFQRHKSKRLSSTSIRIQHEKRDFYKDIKQKTVPTHEILVTNSIQ